VGSGFSRRNIRAYNFAGGKEPVLYLNNPDGVSPQSRRVLLDRLNELNHPRRRAIGRFRS